MTAEQLTLLDHATTELKRIQKLSSLGLRPKSITTKAAKEAGIPESAMRRAKHRSFLDYDLPHGRGKVRIEFVEQANHKDFWRIWEYE
jgi:hypothetical protein